ncbi:transposase [Agrobacterium rhizogenes]|nr:transposase [Rhizobium rhizogenes]NTI53294.1 transposase [Rhizobium rhizogenes]NTI98667.1 transposase [Rhizobium rhizogenes]NTJ61135.1 transposase [Rhizobium rhizogenes]
MTGLLRLGGALAVGVVDEQPHDECRQRLLCSFRQRLPLRHRWCLPAVCAREQIELICRKLAWHGHLPDSFRERSMLRSYPRLVTECLPLPATLPKQAGKQNRHTQLARPTTVHSVFGQTSTPELRATGMTSNPKGCSGTRQTPCPPVHGYGQAAQTRDATDIKAPEPRSRGCSVALLYNSRRPHSSLDRQTPDQAYFNALAPMMVAA